MENLDRSHESCCKIPADTAVCPRCGKRGRKVGAVTLDHHLPSSLRAKLLDSAGFCPNPLCETVYFSGEFVALRGETLLPVTQKDDGDGVHVCYCFNFKRADIRRDLREQGRTDIPDKIKLGIVAGRCDCERENPQGACCLGNVVEAVKAIQTEMQAG